ncbi:efflux RND transporter periplasmic adaptor subunit [Flavobacteriaceae bacterium XHP0103]|uniref:efflux RND transporter periplasmic adaptor subunit n=1 Tax=Marixanthotalea marina TaxID=2844359 RepID=UPI002989EC67|nr:efflux RND transporter periplasmic adaptor subunit [Marixanthotalea marina]MBU3822060.1 efflux RND transporter periplasmic adaptor subunit [Marixanthotalea marina]
MKKYLVYIVVLLVGIVLGWVFFNGSSNQETQQHDHIHVTEGKQMWTCSMHPQIMQPEPGNCPICGMELIPAEVSSEGMSPDQFKLTENAMALANIQTMVVGESAGGSNNIELSGKIAENEEANLVQVSYVSGRIEQLKVSFTGEEVNKGQLLATIYSPELYAAQQELLTAVNMKTAQPKLYEAVRNKLKLWKLTDAQINQIETTGEVKENIPVYATVTGTVTDKLVEQGDYIKQGQALFKIANLNSVWANFDVYENQVDLIKKGQDISITTNAFPNKIIEAKVDFIEPVLNINTRTVTLRAVLNNFNKDLKPGMFIKGKINIKSQNNNQVLTVPSSSVLWTGERSVVYVKTSANSPVFEMREVTLANKTGDMYEVLSGLNDGDEIVNNGTFTVDAAAQLQGKKSMMNSGGKNTLEPSGLNTNERIQVSQVFQDQLKKVLDAYINIKDALVNDDSKNAKTEANFLLENLALVDMELLPNAETHQIWMPLRDNILDISKRILNTSNVKKQRSDFKLLSFQLTKAVEVFGVNRKVYLQYCPMADNEKGAYWLSEEQNVLNPYFGDSMLTCGEVKQEIE